MAQGHPTVHLDESPEMLEFNCEKNKPASSGRVITAFKTIDLQSGPVQYGRHSDYKVYYWENEAKLTQYGVELSF